jgi:hypothetical protein
MADFRALCKELMDAIDSGVPVERIKQSPLAVRVDAALAQPEPQGPSDEELLRCYGLAKRDHCHEGPIDDWPKRAERAATVHGLHAVLARWGRPAIEPVPGVEGADG